QSKSRLDYTYDEFGRVKSIVQWSVTGTATTAPASKIDVQYDNNGDRHIVTWSVSGSVDWLNSSVRSTATFQTISTSTYTLDELQRVTAISEQFDATTNGKQKWASSVQATDRKVVIGYNGDGTRESLNRYNINPTATLIGVTKYDYRA